MLHRTNLDSKTDWRIEKIKVFLLLQKQDIAVDIFAADRAGQTQHLASLGDNMTNWFHESQRSNWAALGRPGMMNRQDKVNFCL